MAVLLIGEVPGMTEDVYAGMIAGLGDRMRGYKGFISHAGGPVAGGWRVVEMWETQADADRWFEEMVKPNLPPGVSPDRKYEPLHTVLKA
jgi:hypothetical protein